MAKFQVVLIDALGNDTSTICAGWKLAKELYRKEQLKGYGGEIGISLWRDEKCLKWETI